MSKSKPNILMLVTDHQLYYRHGWDGGQKPLTPHRDALAAKGVTFTRSYAISPLCSPARRSLLCGRYPHTHRNFHNQSNIPFTSPVYFQQLEKAGYESYFFGKWHAGPGDAHSLGAKGFSLPGYGNPYTTVKYAQYCRRLGIPKAVHCIETLFWNNDTQRHFPLLKEGNEAYRCTGTWCGETAFGTTTTDKRSHESFFLAHLAQQELQRLAKQEQSFHLRVDFWGPHQPYFPTQEYLDLYNPKDIGEYGSFCDDLARKPDVYRHMNQPIADEHPGRYSTWRQGRQIWCRQRYFQPPVSISQGTAVRKRTFRNQGLHLLLAGVGDFPRRGGARSGIYSGRNPGTLRRNGPLGPGGSPFIVRTQGRLSRFGPCPL